MLIRLLVVVSFMLLTGCGTAAVQVTAEHDPAVDFSKYKTFAWHPQGMTSIGIPAQRAAAAQTIIREVVEQDLSRAGYKHATYGTPDFYIVSTIGAVNLTKVRKWGTAEGGFTQTASQVPMQSEQMREGSIVVDFIDNKTSQLLWRGMAHGAVNPEANMRPQVEGPVRTMMGKFPPK